MFEAIKYLPIYNRIEAGYNYKSNWESNSALNPRNKLITYLNIYVGFIHINRVVSELMKNINMKVDIGKLEMLVWLTPGL